MATMKIEVTKTDGFTNRVLAHDAQSGLLVVDRAGVQEVVDHPRVRHLISQSVIKEASGKVEDDEAARLEAQRNAELTAAQEQAAAAAKAEQEAIDAAAKAEKAKK